MGVKFGGGRLAALVVLLPSSRRPQDALAGDDDLAQELLIVRVQNLHLEVVHSLCRSSAVTAAVFLRKPERTLE